MAIQHISSGGTTNLKARRGALGVVFDLLPAVGLLRPRESWAAFERCRWDFYAVFSCFIFPFVFFQLSIGVKIPAPSDLCSASAPTSATAATASTTASTTAPTGVG